MVEGLNLLCIGNMTVDELADGSHPGGSVYYSGAAAHALGASVQIVTSFGDDFPLEDVRQQFPFDLARCGHSSTTRMRNTYTPAGRLQVLVGTGASIDLDAVPQAWLNPDITLLCPVFRELTDELASSVRGRLTGASLQGWLRSARPGGEVTPCYDVSFLQLLSGVDAFFFSDEDVQGHRELINEFRKVAPMVVETRGPDGAILYRGNSLHTVPGFKVAGVDPTGAGDTFAAAFLIAFAQEGDAVEAARRACAVAAVEVNHVGPLSRSMLELESPAAHRTSMLGLSGPGGERNHGQQD